MNKTIEVVVSSAGAVQLETKGFAGANCVAASAALEKELGLAASDERTAEFFQSSITNAQQQNTRRR